MTDEQLEMLERAARATFSAEPRISALKHGVLELIAEVRALRERINTLESVWVQATNLYPDLESIEERMKQWE